MSEVIADGARWSKTNIHLESLHLVRKSMDTPSISPIVVISSGDGFTPSRGARRQYLLRRRSQDESTTACILHALPIT